MEEENQNNSIQSESTKDEEETSANQSDLVQDESIRDEAKSLEVIQNDLVQDEPITDDKDSSEVKQGNLVQDKSIKDEETYLEVNEQDDSIKDNEKSSEVNQQDESIKNEEKSSEVNQTDLIQDEFIEDKEKFSEVDQSTLVQDESTKEEEKSPEKSLEQEKSEFEKQIKAIFSRPSHLEPRHPIFSSPFVRHIAVKAFGPKKPKWYTPLTSAQLYLFKDMVNFIEIGRQGFFHFEAFMEALQDFDPGITRAEVLNILENMEKNEFEELDFGKFLFLLAFLDEPPDVKDEDEVEKALSTPVVTPRQCLILSAISYYVLIASPEEITRYYIANTRRKATVLHYHMEAARLLSLTEKQMEEKQRKVMQNLGPLFALTGLPYACPVPFIRRTKKPKIYRTSPDRKLSRPHSALPMKKKSIQRPITAIEPSRELGGPVLYKTKDDKMYYDMHYGRIPMPMLQIPGKIRKEMNKRCTVEHKDYITRKAYEALAEYKDRLKKATVLYNNRSLDSILKKGFPTTAEEEAFIEVYKRYMPLKLEDVKNFSLWVKPANYEFKHDGKPLYPDNFAFGKKIP